MDILPTLLTTLGFGLLGYLSGSLPFAIWITRLFEGVDVREAGSGHATTTNTIRQARFGPGALVLAGHRQGLFTHLAGITRGAGYHFVVLWHPALRLDRTPHRRTGRRRTLLAGLRRLPRRDG